MSSSKKNQACRSSKKRMSYGVPRNRNRFAQSEAKRSFFPNEDWYEPIEGEKDGYRIIEKDPGIGLVHVVTPAEVADRLALLPPEMLADLDVVQLGRITKKKKSFPCYGMQWGTALYLYPLNEALVETYAAPPLPRLLVETRMYGGKWTHDAVDETWTLAWTEQTARDFYLNNILIHELGHLLDDRNTGYEDRERFAEWFAVEYGYKQSRSKEYFFNRKLKARKRHHS